MRNKLFYGWYIVAASVVLSVLFSTIFVYGFTAFINPIMVTFGWSYAQIALASSLRGLETGAFNPLWGVAVDRWSSKKLMLFSMTAMAVGVFSLSRSFNLLTYYLSSFIIGIGSSLISGVLPSTVVARWFKRNIGKANGILAMGIGLGGVATPLVVAGVDRYGWQAVLLFAAIAFLVLGVPLSFVYRDRPQDYGLLPDGLAAAAAVGPGRSINFDFTTPVRQALQMRAFWQFGFVVFIQFTVFNILAIYMIPYLTSLGFDRATGGLVVMVYTLVSLSLRIPVGMISDRWRKSRVIAFTLALMALGVGLLYLLDKQSPFWLVILFGIAYGIGVSGITPLRPPVLAEYFGTRNFGTIFGLNSIFSTVATIVPAPLVGLVFDRHANYGTVLLAMVALSVLGMVLMLTMPSALVRGDPATSQPAPTRTSR